MSGLVWSRETAPAELVSLLEELGCEYDIHVGDVGAKLEFEKLPESPRKSFCRRIEGGCQIGYSDAVTAARALGSALAGEEEEVTTTFRTLGIMLDVSRGMVMTVAATKKFLRRCALMGYNMVMLYDEDVFKLDNEPYFGYMRGAYTIAEIREIDDYASRLGIEMCGCIQMLAHFKNMLYWPSYAEIRDTMDVVLVDEPKTYALLQKIIDFWSSALRNRRIHIGMDEALDLGRGRLLDRNGLEKGFDVFNRHLARVMDMCRKSGLEPMIWGDMYFRLCSPKKVYYDTDTVFTPEVKRAVPSGVQLVYWDYCSTEAKFYRDMIRLHRELTDKPVIVASCLWTFDSLWSDRSASEITVRPCVEACVAENVDELIFTMWQNEASICPIETSYTQLAWSADLCFGFEDKERTGKRFGAIFSANYGAHVEASLLNIELGGLKWYQDIPLKLHFSMCNPLIAVGDDPLIGIGFNNMRLYDPDFDRKTIAHMRRQLEKLLPFADDHEAGDIAHAINIARLVIAKLEVRRALEEAYDRGDRDALRELADKSIPEAIECVRAFWNTYRAQWIKVSKPFGMERTQNEMYANIGRLEELRQRLYEYVNGEAENIPELDERLPEGTTPFFLNSYLQLNTVFRGR